MPRLLRWNWLPYSVLFVLAGSAPGHAQCHDWAPGFEPSGVDASVEALTVFNDGSGDALYAAAGTSVEKWNGSSWSALSGAFDAPVHALTVFDDGSGGGRALYAAGSFTQIDGLSASRIAKWDGSSWSAVGTGTDSDVFALTVFNDGSGGGPALYAGGRFQNAGGVAANRAAKWDGSNWSPLGSGVSSDVFALTIFDDGSGGGRALYAAGLFNTAGGVPVNKVAKWNGTAWSSLGSGLSGYARALTVHDDGSGGGPALFVGGVFITAGGVGANRVAKWNGTSWSALGSGIGSAVVDVLGTYDDGSGSGPALYAGGLFDSAGGVTVANIAKWNGTSWSKLDRGTDGEVKALVAFDDGSSVGSALYVGGPITGAGDLAASNIARWDGSEWSTVGGQGLGGDSPEVRAMKAFDDGSGGGLALYAAGRFTSAGGLSVNSIAKWSGTSWSPLKSGVNGSVRALEIFDDGTGGGAALYAGGLFNAAGGTASNIAAWNGSVWSALGTGVDNAVGALAVFDDRSGGGLALYAAGSFLTAGGVAANRIAKWNGTSWTALGNGLDGVVRALAVYDDGLGGGPMLVAGGDFTTAGGAGPGRTARWNGTTWRPLGSPFGVPLAKVHALVVFDDAMGGGPMLYAGGEFTGGGGEGAYGIARWNGTTWTPVSSSTDGFVYALAVFDDGSGRGSSLYAGGSFLGLDGVTASNIARFDGAVWTPLGSGLDNAVTALAAFDDGSSAGPDLYAGGSFYHAGGRPASSIARWGGCGQPGQAVCFGDGSVVPCPCGNDGTAGRGCENSHATGGAQLSAVGWTSLANDTLVLTSSGEGSNPLSIFLEGGNPGAPIHFGDGLLCAGAPFTRLYTKVASGGVVSAPQPGDASVSARSIASGNTLTSGTSRSYQVYYRDANLAFCPNPPGNGWNVSSGMRIGWTP